MSHAVQAWGTVALTIGAVGVGVWALVYLVSVRWWTDNLGRALAAVFGSMGMMCTVIIVVTMGIPIPAVQHVRAVLYTAFAVSVWAGVVAFLWAQFAAPRLRRTRRDHTKGERTMTSVKFPVWVAVAGTVLMTILTGVQTATSDGTMVDRQEIIQIAIGVVTAFAVWAAANLPGALWIKPTVAAVLAALNILVTAILGGVSTGEFVNMAIAVLIALGVVATPTPVTTVIAGRVRTFVKGEVPASR